LKPLKLLNFLPTMHSKSAFQLATLVVQPRSLLLLVCFLGLNFSACAQKSAPQKGQDAASKPDYNTQQWSELVRLDSTIRIDLRYATTNNFVKAQMYDCPRCFLRPEAAAALVKAHKILQSKGYGGLKMFDCYRPRPIQQKLWDKMPDANYVTPPAKGSMHNRGLAADLTIVDKNGQELDMGTPFDDFTEKAHYDYTKHPKNILENRRLLRGILEQVGFKGIRTEWWHFSFGGKQHDLADWLWNCR
jgi:zinc D-Ala-D-Ala dipeptidase